jgi:hypothetical protein
MNGAKVVGRIVRLMLAAAVSATALAGAVHLETPASTGVERQLTFIREALGSGAGAGAQSLFPEGYFFAHALYGLAWVDLGLGLPPGRRGKALREARWALEQLDSPAGKEPFSAALTPAYGVFYVGWTNWLRGGIVQLQPAGERNPAEVQRFTADSTSLAAAFDGSGSPYLQAYPGQAWPVDSTVAIASLTQYDRIMTPRFSPTKMRWLAAVRQRLDPRTGLLPHRVDPDTGAPQEVARGSSQSVIQRFLPDVDPGFAGQQYLVFRKDFVARPLGLGPAVREYPHGVDGPADVDSGPLPLGISLSATVVSVGAARVNGDDALADALASYGEFAGLPIDTGFSKRYAFGALPIGDAFLAWARSARPWVSGNPPAPATTVTWAWKVPLLVVLVIVGVAPWIPALRRRRRKSSTVD